MAHKYHAKPTTVDGIRFASQAEARRYGELKLLEKAGEIRSLILQPKYDLSAGGVIVGRYIADFAYFDATGRSVIEDVKGVKTATYRLKKKMFEAEYGIQITEIGRATKATKAKRAATTRRSAAPK